MVFTRKMRQQNKRILSQFDETSDDFVIGNINMTATDADEVESTDENVFFKQCKPLSNRR